MRCRLAFFPSPSPDLIAATPNFDLPGPKTYSSTLPIRRLVPLLSSAPILLPLDHSIWSPFRGVSFPRDILCLPRYDGSPAP